jgi:hypothetical protein
VSGAGQKRRSAEAQKRRSEEAQRPRSAAAQKLRSAEAQKRRGADKPTSAQTQLTTKGANKNKQQKATTPPHKQSQRQKNSERSAAKLPEFPPYRPVPLTGNSMSRVGCGTVCAQRANDYPSFGGAAKDQQDGAMTCRPDMLTKKGRKM